jgi:hypothetical protein
MNRIPKDKTQKTNKEVNFHTNFPVLSGEVSERAWRESPGTYMTQPPPADRRFATRVTANHSLSSTAMC